MQRTRPTVVEAVDVIHAAGGVTVWAHPFWDVDDPEEVLASIGAFAKHGLDGVEVFYPTHTARALRPRAVARAHRRPLRPRVDVHPPLAREAAQRQPAILCQ